ncbi:hypothetical protein B0H21DRAFT_777944 [Amylocystis lapponica]|nr:hypothetical protein B0H21DRAFT_777944 [Amylocystis lapponica]
MPPSPVYRRDYDHDAVGIAFAASDMSLRDPSPIFSFDDPPHYDTGISDSDQMIFEFEDANHYGAKSPFAWDSDYTMHSTIPFPGSPESTGSQLDGSYAPPGDRSFTSEFFGGYGEFPNTSEFNDGLYSHWLKDPDMPSLSSSSVPIPIPAGQSQSQSPPSQSSFVAYSDPESVFPDVTAFSPMTAFAALQPLPRSFSPAEDTIMTEALRGDARNSLSPSDAQLRPSWATQLWDSPSSQNMTLSASPVPFPPLSEDAFATQRQRIFQSSSAPSVTHARPPPLTRAYSRRSESISEHDDRDATVRKKKRTRPVPLKSTLRPPKLAPSAWQLYFTDWISRHQASSHKKLNVAQAAKEAGQEYAKLTTEEKERENAFRTAQRKAGKSRKGNIKDPNAPKKPLSAYFMFLQRIRSDPELVREVFGDETETTKQSVLAAGKWRSMTDDERKPFLAQAEQEKLEYETARKMYEEGTTGYGSSINFSILPSNSINSMPFPSRSLRPLMKQEVFSSESDSDGLTDDTDHHHS